MEGTIITKKGTALIAKLLASGKELAFTRAAVGTGTIPSGYDPAGMTDLSAYRMNGKISGCSTDGDEATVVFQISSAEVEEGLTITEAGLYARDPDDGEVLYAYLDLSGDPQYVYARDSAIQKFAEIEFTTVVGRLERVTVVMSPGALVTREEFEERAGELSGEIQAVSQTIPVFELEGSTLVISRGIWGGGTGGGGGGGSAYILPAATAKRLGGVKIGDGIDVTTDGTISTDVTAVAEAAAAEMEKNTEEYTADEIQALFNGA